MKAKNPSKLKNCPKFGEHIGEHTANYDSVGDDRDLLPAAEECYKALRELPSICLSAWEGEKMANRIKDYIDALEKKLAERQDNI